MTAPCPLKVCLAILLVACSLAVGLLCPAATRAAGTLTLEGQLVPGPGTFSDVCGWVNPADGKEYAIVGELNDKHVWIVDVSNPSNPTVVSTLDNVPGFDLKTWQHYLYLVDGAPTGLSAIYDISDPANPKLAGSKFGGAHNIFIDNKGYLYLEQYGLRIFNLNPDPTKPTFVWQKVTADGHDCAVIGDRLFDFHGRAGTFIYDVSNRNTPRQIGAIVDPQITFHHSGWTSKNGRYLYINDELATNPSPDFTVWDILDPAFPIKVKLYKDSGATIHNSYRVGNFLYIAYYSSGVKVYDITNPRNPVFAAGFDTSALGGEGYKGAFGLYPFTPSGNFYVTDMQSGLYVFSFTPAQSAVLISNFEAQYSDGAITMNWSIGDANDLQGFNIYRAEGTGTPYLKINEALLPTDGIYEFVDDDIVLGRTYTYCLGAIDRDGEFLSPKQTVTTPKGQFVLYQNHPNPFNPTTTLSYYLPESADVTLVIYDGLGRRVRTLVSRFESAGNHDAVWDGTNDGGRRVASGVYFSRLETATGVATKRMILLK